MFFGKASWRFLNLGRNQWTKRCNHKKADRREWLFGGLLNSSLSTFLYWYVWGRGCILLHLKKLVEYFIAHIELLAHGNLIVSKHVGDSKESTAFSLANSCFLRFDIKTRRKGHLFSIVYWPFRFICMPFWTKEYYNADSTAITAFKQSNRKKQSTLPVTGKATFISGCSSGRLAEQVRGFDLLPLSLPWKKKEKIRNKTKQIRR